MTAKGVLKTIFFLYVGIVAGWLSPVNAPAEEAKKETHKLESGVYYTIQKGDTLWDLSERFFDSPWVWPDLWEKNKQIPNPHWIYPNNRIQIYGREAVEKIPVSKPEEKPIAPTETSVTVEPAEERHHFTYPTIDGVGFIRDNPVTPLATIFKVRGEAKVMISTGDMVYVRPEPAGEGQLAKGKRFTVFRTLKRVTDPETGAFIGVPHSILGVVEITKVQPRYCICKVIKSFRPIEVNDHLMPYEKRDEKIPLMPSKEGLEGRVIMSEAHNKKIMAHQTVLFIDRGRRDGVEVGQVYSTYYQEKEFLDPAGKEVLLLAPVDFGQILVLRAEETTATALITKADKAIQPWDKIHAPAVP